MHSVISVGNLAAPVLTEEGLVAECQVIYIDTPCSFGSAKDSGQAAPVGTAF